MGEGDFHDPIYDYTEQVIQLSHYTNPETINTSGHCVYSFYVYSTNEYKKTTTSNAPEIYVISISVILFILICFIRMFDNAVQQQNSKIVNAAVRSNQVVASMFPSHIRDQLLAEPDKKETDSLNMSSHMMRHRPSQLKGDFLGLNESSNNFGCSERDDDSTMYPKPPIADLYTDTTIMFADIAGFTAWSSAREPQQVFVLLETVYAAFDEIAVKRRVYKVETVGDCYVAVTGLPDPRKDHAGMYPIFFFLPFMIDI